VSSSQPNGDFLPSAESARHEQIRDIRASNQQHQSHDDQQNHARKRHAALASRVGVEPGRYTLHRDCMAVIHIGVFPF
jgi:hypothetical protein